MKKYTVKEVSRIMNVSSATVMRRIKDGSLKAYKQNGKFIISEEEFNTFLKVHPKYSKKVQPHQSEVQDVVDIISANEAFNRYAIYLKKLMMLPKDDETINYIMSIVENHKSLLDMCINELKKGKK